MYVGSLYVPIAPIAPLAIAMPFFGPKCRAGRGLRALEEDIRLAQGAAVQDKGGLEPKEKLEDFLLGINWPMMIYISANHLTAVYALVVFFFLGGVCPIFGNGVSMKWQTCVWAGVVYVLSGLGITGGVHRLWSHRSYKAEFPLRVLLMLFNSCANQGTIFHCARDHRVHHLYSDTVADPHNAMNGFFYCHVGWLVTKKHPAVAAAGKGVNVSDLLADPVVMFSDDLSPVVFCFNWDSFLCKWLCSCVVVGFAWVLELVDFSALGLVGGRLSSSGHVSLSTALPVFIVVLAPSLSAVREAILPALMCTLGSFSSSSSDEQNYNEWSPLLELFFHWRIGRYLEAMVDDVSTATVAFTCHFALDVLCEK